MKHSNKQHYVVNDTSKMTLTLADYNGDWPNLLLKPVDTTPITKKDQKSSVWNKVTRIPEMFYYILEET